MPAPNPPAACGCYYFAGDIHGAPVGMRWCPLHASAPDLLAALEVAIENEGCCDVRCDHAACVLIHAAIRKAKGGA